jgi:hercynylcysteine S-oxide lyase
VEALSAKIESRPDKFLRRVYADHLAAVRERLAHLIGAETEEIVMVNNATHGINTILRNFFWNPDDVIVGGEFVSKRLVHLISFRSQQQPRMALFYAHNNTFTTFHLTPRSPT